MDLRRQATQLEIPKLLKLGTAAGRSDASDAMLKARLNRALETGFKNEDLVRMMAWS
jgi:hypothetical protein